jgi:hypothetical protein
MSSRESTARFHSPVAALMEQFVQQKQACGYKYGEAVRILARFDRSLCDGGLSQCELPRALSRQWLAKQAHESASTHQGRSSVRPVHAPAGISGRCAGSIAHFEVQCRLLAAHPDGQRGSAATSRGRSAHADCPRAAAPPHHARGLPPAVRLRLPAQRGVAYACRRCRPQPRNRDRA